MFLSFQQCTIILYTHTRCMSNLSKFKELSQMSSLWRKLSELSKTQTSGEQYQQLVCFSYKMNMLFETALGLLVPSKESIKKMNRRPKYTYVDVYFVTLRSLNVHLPPDLVSYTHLFCIARSIGSHFYPFHRKLHCLWYSTVTRASVADAARNARISSTWSNRAS